MKVILLQDVKKLGHKGDVVNVADGHARNYLLPRGLAVEATEARMQELKKQQRKESEKRAQEEKEARELAAKLEKVKVNIAVKVGGAGKLFGAVSSKDIADALQASHGLKLDKKKIVLKEPIKTLGTHPVTIKLHPKVQAKLDVRVTEK